MTGRATVNTVYTLWVSSLSFQLLAEVNGPAAADDSYIIMAKSVPINEIINPYFVMHLTVTFVPDVFQQALSFYRVIQFRQLPYNSIVACYDVAAKYAKKVTINIILNPYFVKNFTFT